MNTCDVCKGGFRTKSATRDHKRETGHCVCKRCHKILNAEKDLEEHINAVHKVERPQCATKPIERCVCKECHKSLDNQKDLEEHVNAVHKYKCPQCAMTFQYKLLLKNHQKGKRHCYCGDCNKAFGSTSGLTNHLQSSRHPTEFHCCDCKRDFTNSDALEQHLRDKVHKRPRPVVARSKPKSSQPPKQHVQGSVKSIRLPYTCPKCTKGFKTPKCLKKHLLSLAHNPLSNFQCIAGASCKKRFPSLSALLHHLESGACSSGMDYEMIKRIVTHHDTENIVTRGQGHIRDMLEEVSNKLRSRLPNQTTASDTKSEVVISTPSSSLSQACWTPEDGSMKDWAMAVSQSSHRRCPFCDPSRRPFVTQQALQDHLQSAAHCKPFVFCPVNLADGKSGASKMIRVFTTVSGLLQHLESGACYDGIAGFWKTANYLEKRLQMWGLNFRLTIKSKGNSR